MSEKLLIVDGHSMAYRAFFALPPDSFTVAGGQHTNAVYGFFSMLAKLLETEKPTHLAVAFDPSRESFRTEIYPEYKGTRDKTPPEFVGQVELIGAVLDKLGVPSLTVADFEADDVLATLSTEAKKEGFDVLVASGDRDTFQLVDDKVTVLYPGRSASDLTYMSPEVIEARYGVAPGNYPELAALVGETSDNLPGVPGVGPKTAAQWLKRFDGLDNLLENCDQIKGKRGEALREHEDDVRRNRRLNHLVTDMDLDITPAQCVASSPDRGALDSLFDTLEFTGLRGRIYKAMTPLWNQDASLDVQTMSSPQDQDGADPQGETSDATAGEVSASDVGPYEMDAVSIVTFATDLSEVLEGMWDGPVALWGIGRLAPTSPHLDILALADKNTVVVLDTADLSPEQDEVVGRFLNDHHHLVVHGGKALAHGVHAQGWNVAQPEFDTELAAYLCNPAQRSYDLDQLALQYLGEEPPAEDDGAIFSVEMAQGLGEDIPDQGPSSIQVTAARSAVTVLRLLPPLRERLEERNALPLLTSIEIPVSMILYDMETLGIAMDREVLERLRSEYGTEMERAARDAYEAIGHEVNLGSPKQLQGVLFEELAMPKTRKTRTGYTTDAEALADLYAKTGHAFLEALLRHRDRAKLVQMIDSLLAEIQPDGRIHTTFSQTVAATGRLASSEPNLQNIPARTEAGLRIREAFVAGKGYGDLMSVDYSQIEMRIMAHLSQDQDLIAAFNSGEDLHKTMASQVFGVPVSEVDSELRNRIKATSYGLAYGLSPFGLSRQLGVSVEEAKDLHRQYFVRFGGIGKYLREVVEEARHDGYTQTMFGRRRYFPELTSSVRRVREMAERAALNAPIQGSAADIIKIAMVTVHAELLAGGFDSRMILQVHDELVLEIAPGESEAVKTIVSEAMGNSVRLSVPLDVAVGEGHSWRAAAH